MLRRARLWECGSNWLRFTPSKRANFTRLFFLSRSSERSSEVQQAIARGRSEAEGKRLPRRGALPPKGCLPSKNKRNARRLFLLPGMSDQDYFSFMGKLESSFHQVCIFLVSYFPASCEIAPPGALCQGGRFAFPVLWITC